MAGWKNPKTALEYINGSKTRKRRQARLVTGVSSSPVSQQASEGSAPSKKRVRCEDGTTSSEEMTIEGSGQKVYKMDLRGASVTFNMS